MNQQHLIKRAVKLFPITLYCDIAAVRHARRRWVQAMMYMRHRKILALDMFVSHTSKKLEQRSWH